MLLEEAIKHILDGNALLFLGAGFSRDATNISNKKMADAVDFSNLLSEEMNLDEVGTLDEVTDLYLQSAPNERELENRKSNLIREIQNLFYTKEITNYQKEIAKLPWKRIYTTNYDDTVEFAYDFKINTYTMNSKQNDILNKNCVVHLNGYARSVSSDELENDFKLTTRSYLVDSFLASESKKAFDHDVRNSKAIIIIGASLKYDLDIQRVLYMPDEVKKKIMFIDKNGDRYSKIDSARKELIGDIHNIGAEGLLEEVLKVNQSYIPKQSNEELKSFSIINNSYNYTYKELDETDIWSLLIHGEIEDLLLNINKENNDYLIQRDVLGTIAGDLMNPKMRVGIIHSHLGNGKTCVSKMLAHKLTGKYEVFEFIDLDGEWELEIEKINRMEGDKVVFIDNYHNHLGVVYKILHMTTVETKLILTSRSFINQSVYFRLEEKIAKDQIINEYDINSLTEKEIIRLSKYLIDRNFTGVFDSSIEETAKIIRTQCNSSMLNVLLFIMKSKIIEKKINDVIEPILNDKIKKDILLAVIVNNSCTLDLRFDEIISLLGHQLNIATLKRDKNLNEIVDIDNNIIKMKSSILSKHILVSKNLNMSMVDIIEKMVVEAVKLSDGSCKIIREKLISISNVREILVQTRVTDNKAINQQVLNYFDRLEKLKVFNSNIFFWMQYGMACIDANKYDRAEVYFDNAYKLAEKAKNFNTYQIDTQYGRFILERNIDEDRSNESVKDLKEAVKYWRAAINKNRTQTYYVYKQFYLIESSILKNLSRWNSQQKNQALSICNTLIDLVSKERRDYRHTLKSLENCKKKILISAIGEKK
ncbi:hypothetical protein [Planococcus sp. SSTMD024]|uniref:SIR2 family protein n=1 Tax=Planococcus sp. SSTMD024 TaxID=3242163 RepID=UPI00351E4819